MSASREVIAIAIGVPPEDIRCDRCENRDKEGRVIDPNGEVSPNVWCLFWKDDTPPDAFCSFFEEE